MAADLNSDLPSPFMPMKGSDDSIVCARHLLRAARRKFFTKPYDTVSMEEIATRAGLSEAKALGLFASKEELFASLVVQEMAAAAVEIWCRTIGSTDMEAVLLQVARNYVGLFGSNRATEIYRSLICVSARFPHLGRIIYEHGARVLLERLSAYIAARNAEGHLAVSDPDLAAQQFLSLVHGNLHLREVLAAQPVSDKEIDRVIESGVRLFLAGYRSDRRDASQAAQPGRLAREAGTCGSVKH
ncbi:TetR/AcrR family transcriptional regulator [Labrys sp. KNU-23]|uniref:TetR/AcrR family transcriptional regulator n=1 Tax=Labrys sp. KNU-23 TaxID=2789216 RepID=UPI0011F076C1|nr:TetR/AcrR family transcriptional regulator [Labrys sp. KNU-23]QEN87741.1 TetR/AcrR family transcriptional regulator [Labrys sp. KNU-23]